MAVKTKTKLPVGKATLNVCHLADVHLGYRRYGKLTQSGSNQREIDVNQSFSEAVTRIISIRPDVTIIAGDLFHTVRPSNSTVTFCFRELKRLAGQTSAPVVILAGNHETPKRSDTGNVLRLMSEIPGVFVADSIMERFQFKDLELSVLCLPHAALNGLRRQDVRADDRFKFNILALHAQVDRSWISDFGGVDLSLNGLSPNEWDYIALGHVHIQKEITHNSAYCGSTDHTATNIWSEGDRNKGFLQIMLPENKKIFHALTSPRELVLLEPINAAGLEAVQVSERIDQALENIAGGADGKLVRLVVTDLPREIYRQLDHKMIRKWRARCLNLSLDLQPPLAGGPSVRPILNRRGRMADELSEFCKSYPLQMAAHDEIKEVLISYLLKMEEQHEATAPSS